jgi:energy-converting hydrogenase Eha subunit F
MFIDNQNYPFMQKTIFITTTSGMIYDDLLIYNYSLATILRSSVFRIFPVDVFWMRWVLLIIAESEA